LTGSRANAFGCGGAWGDLDVLVVPKLPGVAVYQYGLPNGCPIKELKFKKDITVAQDSVVWVTGHVIAKSSGTRPDLHLYHNGAQKDWGLAASANKQWEDISVHYTAVLKKGKHSFELKGNIKSAFGCGAAWGDLDLLVVPKFKGVQAYQSPDKGKGCPANRKANTDLISQKITVDQTSVIKVVGHMIRTYKGRADAYLYVNKNRVDYSLTYTNTKVWEDVKLHYVGTLKKGTHTISIRANKANSFGCGGAWGDIDVLVLPEKLG